VLHRFRFQFVSLRPLVAGEALFISYTDPHLPLDVQKSVLRSQYLIGDEDDESSERSEQTIDAVSDPAAVAVVTNANQHKAPQEVPPPNPKNTVVSKGVQQQPRAEPRPSSTDSAPTLENVTDKSRNNSEAPPSAEVGNTRSKQGANRKQVAHRATAPEPVKIRLETTEPGDEDAVIVDNTSSFNSGSFEDDLD